VSGSGVRIGVVADTHVGEFLDELPSGVDAALAGCDLILHAGDLSGAGVIERLGRIAPVVAVRGDHDRPDAPRLPRAAVIRAGGAMIGLTHGARPAPVDASVVIAGIARGRAAGYRAGLDRHLVRLLGPLDLIVHGHWHEPRLTRVGRTIVFSPGAVCPWGSLQGGRAPRRGTAGVTDRLVRRYRRGLGPEAMRPRVGIVTVGAAGIAVRSVPIAERGP
jgi:putative phosphoesterase